MGKRVRSIAHIGNVLTPTTMGMGSEYQDVVTPKCTIVTAVTDPIY